MPLSQLHTHLVGREEQLAALEVQERGRVRGVRPFPLEQRLQFFAIVRLPALAQPCDRWMDSNCFEPHRRIVHFVVDRICSHNPVNISSPSLKNAIDCKLHIDLPLAYLLSPPW